MKFEALTWGTRVPGAKVGMVWLNPDVAGTEIWTCRLEARLAEFRPECW